MILHLKLVEKYGSVNRYTDHRIPVENIDSYGRFSEDGPGFEDTLIITKANIRYRVQVPVEEMDAIYDEWAEQSTFYSLRN